MCFSPTASFTGGSILILLGLATVFIVVLSHCKANAIQRIRYLPLAIVPFIFGIQQISEGFVWLNLQNEDAICSFTFFAYGFWPFWIPLSFLIVEYNHLTKGYILVPHKLSKILPKHWLSLKTRFWWIFVNTIIGLPFLVITSIKVAKHNTSANVKGHHIVYSFGTDIAYAKEPNDWNGEDAAIIATYIYLIIWTILLSSMKGSTILAISSVVTLVITILIEKIAWTSVWCFFESLVSIVIMGMIVTDLRIL